MKFLIFLPWLLILLISCRAYNPKGPFLKVIRTLNDPDIEKVKLGPFEDSILQVKSLDQISLSVKSLQDAVLNIYLPDKIFGDRIPLVLYIHGGGWVSGSAKNVEPYCKLIASNGFVVANLDHSLAPEYTHPTPIIQSLEALSYLMERAKEYGIDEEQIFIGGNSAGAQISSELTAILVNKSAFNTNYKAIEIPYSSLKGVILFNGVYNFDEAGNTGFPGFDKFAWCYTGVKDYKKYPKIDDLSTSKNITSMFPPTFLVVGDADPLAPQSYELDSILFKNQIEVKSVFWDQKKLNHDYMYDLSIEESRHTYRELIRFLKTYSNKQKINL